MATFSVKLITDSGIKTVNIEAVDQSTAERIAGRNGSVLSVKKKAKVGAGKGMTPSERNIFMARLSTMIGSRLPVTSALQIIAENFKGRIKKCAIDMSNRIAQGMSLGEAIDVDYKNFPPATAALVRAGMASGKSYQALQEAAEFERLITGVQKGAMKEIYAAIATFLMAFGIMAFTVYYLGPLITDHPLFRNNKNIDVFIPQVIGYILVWLMGFKTLLLIGFFWLGTAGRLLSPDQADKLILKVPYYKDLVLSRNSYVVLYQLSLLVKSGIRMEECLALTAEGSPKGALRTDLMRALSFIRQGKAWANALETLHPTDRAALSISQDRKDVTRSLDLLAEQYKVLYLDRIKSFAPVMQTMAALYMSAAGAEMFALTLLPMLQFAASV